MKNRLTVTLDRSFVIDAHKAACVEWKDKLEEKFPEFFNTYRIGDVFYSEKAGTFLQITQCEASMLILTNLLSGNRQKDPIKSADSLAITEEELQDMAGCYLPISTLKKISKSEYIESLKELM